ncbi:DUF1624 domain-containing protein [Mobiluncus mulieris]|uniref:DUF1624 domain-containing protein n=1 Tax=Mobiluncus mulieris TaxID=2052 RepID=A0A7Y0U0J0_9ACTO|nr:heparan-alpha-glucosaminide N-acetyltransferase domain-containing protein [Mobiluncus mulieris]NMW64688.1 DUF1624 domain-containing protein [Mobiluncus mulieris]
MVDELPEIPLRNSEDASMPENTPIASSEATLATTSASAPTTVPVGSAATKADPSVTSTGLPTKPSFFERLLGGAQRIPAFDLARGLAIVGMFTAHILTFDSNLPQSVIGISHGRSAALFAFLAGISLGIIAGREHPPSGVKLLQTRMRVVTRALVLLLIVALLAMYNLGIILILGFYAAWFLASLPFLGWNGRKLLVLGGGLVLVGTPLAIVINQILIGITLQTTSQVDSAAYIYLLSGTYGGAGFLGYIFIGLALTRLGFASDPKKARKLAKKVLAVGCLLFLVGAGGATLADSIRTGHFSLAILGTNNMASDNPGHNSKPPVEPEPTPTPTVFPPETGSLAGKSIPSNCYCDFSKPKSDTNDSAKKPSEGILGGTRQGDITAWMKFFSGLSLNDFDLEFWRQAFLDAAPHSNSLLETLGNLGFSMIVVSLFLLGGRPLAILLFPLAAMGSMALSIYTLHVFWVSVTTLGQLPLVPSFLVMLMCFAVLSCVWRFWLGRGPLERLLHWASHRAARVTPAS